MKPVGSSQGITLEHWDLERFPNFLDYRKAMLQGKRGFWDGTQPFKEHPENKTAVNELQQGRLVSEVVIEGKEEATEPAAAKFALFRGCSHDAGGSRVSKIPFAVILPIRPLSDSKEENER